MCCIQLMSNFIPAQARSKLLATFQQRKLNFVSRISQVNFMITLLQGGGEASLTSACSTAQYVKWSQSQSDPETGDGQFAFCQINSATSATG
jgi:hypothetical protein